jgi:hypothetical protein
MVTKFLPLIAAIESYPMNEVGVQLGFVQFARERIKSAAVTACNEGQSQDVAQALPRIAGLGEAAAKANPDQAAAFLEITSALRLELEELVMKAQGSGKL